MASITTALASGFKLELLKGQHDFDAHTMRVKLIKTGYSGTYGAATAAISELTSNSDEALNGSGSALGHATAAIASGFPQMSGSTAIMDFDDAVFASVTTSAEGAILYNPNADSSADVIAVFNFNGTVSATSGDFTVQFPTGDATNAILRLA